MFGTLIIVVIFISGYTLGFECQNRYCLFGREVCVHAINEYGQLQSNCESIRDVYNFLNDCTTAPTYKLGCYCRTERCNRQVYTDYHFRRIQDSQTDCYDKESIIRCEEANQMYNICSAPSGALRAIAYKVCRKFCGLCEAQSKIELSLPRQDTINVEDAAPIPNIIQTRGRRPTFRECDKLAVLTALGLSKRSYHSGARQCPNNLYQQSDAVILEFCAAPEFSLWSQDLQVSGLCNQLPTYSPIAQYHHNRITDKSGLLVHCNAGGEFLMFLQTCDKPLHLVNVTWPDAETFYTVNWDYKPTTQPPTTKTPKPTTPPTTQPTTQPTTRPTTQPTPQPTTPMPTTKSPTPTTMPYSVTQTSTPKASCSDLVGVDCSLLDISIKVCSLPTATTYCPLYCGLCPKTTPQVNPGQVVGK